MVDRKAEEPLVAEPRGATTTPRGAVRGAAATASYRRHTTSYHHGSLAAALVDEGVTQVRERGADKVSLRALATAVGVSPSAAYQHFGDKDALLLAVGRRGFERLGERMRAGVQAVEYGAGEGDQNRLAVVRLEATGAAYIGFAADEPHLFRLMFGPLCRKPAGGHPGSTGSPGGAGGEDDDAGAYSILQAQLAELDARGLLRVPADEALELLIWSVVHGFSSLVIEGQVEIEALQPLFDTMTKLVLELPPS